MMRLIRSGYDDNGNWVDIEVLVPHEELSHPEREKDICAVCPNVMYPKCMEICAMIKD